MIYVDILAANQSQARESGGLQEATPHPLASPSVSIDVVVESVLISS